MNKENTAKFYSPTVRTNQKARIYRFRPPKKRSQQKSRRKPTLSTEFSTANSTSASPWRSPVHPEIRRVVGRRGGTERGGAPAGRRRGGRHGRKRGPRKRVPDNLRLRLLPAAAPGEHRLVEAGGLLLAVPLRLPAAGALTLAPASALPPRRHRDPPRRPPERGGEL
jgi:hypothetical protein